jgi:caffeoyl-CoA O-methyltransferase
LYAYLSARFSERDPALEDLARETAALGSVSAMQIAPEQGAFMTLLSRAISARSAVEIGTFTGYSTLCLAKGVGEGGRVLTCDVSAEWTAIARRYWARAGLADRIDLRLGPALETLRGLPPSQGFDIAFIDADKQGYLSYFEEILPRLRPSGLILFDNTLWSGMVADPTLQDDNTVALRRLNDLLPEDPRVETVMLPVSDGLTICRKR